MVPLSWYDASLLANSSVIVFRLTTSCLLNGDQTMLVWEEV